MMSFRAMLALCALTCMAAAPVSAQSTRLGVRAGLTSSTVVGDDADGAESITGLSIGAFLAYRISPSFAVQPEFVYVSKGAGGGFEEVEADVKLRYIEIPVLAKFSFGTGPLRPSIFAGPAIAFRTGCEVEVTSGGFEGSFDCDDEELGVIPFKSTDFGGVAGVGFDYDLGTAALVFDARVALGLTSIDDTGEDNDVKNRAWSFTAGASVPIGTR